MACLTDGAGRAFTEYLGAEFRRPGVDGVYRSVFRFDSLAHLEAFERSDFRHRTLAEAADVFEADAAWDRMTGREFWFDPPSGTQVPQPSPHRMALVLVAVVFWLVLVLILALGPLMAGWPLSLRLLLTVIVQVALMSHVIMPGLMLRIARCIYPKCTTP